MPVIVVSDDAGQAALAMMALNLLSLPGTRSVAGGLEAWSPWGEP